MTTSTIPRVSAVLALAVTVATLVLAPNSSFGQTGDGETFRLLTFESGGSGPRLGATRGDGENDIVDIHNAIGFLYSIDAPELRNLPPIPIDMRSLIEAGDRPLQATRTVHDALVTSKAAGEFLEREGSRRVFYPPSAVDYLPVVPDPSKVMSLAGAYQRRAPDGTPGRYDDVEYPSFFFKSPASLTGHGTDINLRGLLTTGVHEPELTVVIGKTASAVSAADALDYIVGYTIMNDVSSRDLPQGGHVTQGGSMSKSLDTFTPLGPYLTLKEDVPDPHTLDIAGYVDGELHAWPVPNGNTSFLTFTIGETIAYLSERMTLLPGDIIATGVPQPTLRFAEGQVIEITIGNLGTLRNRVISVPIPGHTPISPRVGTD